MSSQNKSNNESDLGYNNQAIKNAPLNGMTQADAEDKGFFNVDRIDLQNQPAMLKRQTPAAGMGTDLNIGGSQIHLDPGASITIGANGQITPNNNQLSANSIQKTNFPFDHQINHGLELGMNPDPGLRKVSTLGTRMDMANDTRSQYSHKGLDATAMKLGNDEQSALSNQINQLQDQNKGLSLNNNKDLNNELQM